MNHEHRGNWWKAAASAGGHNAVFRKLLEQAVHRGDRRDHMSQLLLSGGAPSWLTDQLFEYMTNRENEFFPEWMTSWAGTQLSQEARNPLSDFVREYMAVEDPYWIPSWLKDWMRSLCSKPDDTPKWLDDLLIEYHDRYEDVPYWAYEWFKAKLEDGKNDEMRHRLESIVFRKGQENYLMPGWMKKTFNQMIWQNKFRRIDDEKTERYGE